MSSGNVRDIRDTPVLPSEDQIDDLILKPDSLAYRLFADPRLFLASGYALLMQVAHPTVGSGVRDHSDFDRRPWDRLLRTTDYLFLITFSGRDSAAVGRRVRELHKSIKGTNPDGSRYHSLEPEAYAWVQATLIEGGLRAYKRFVGRLTVSEEEMLIEEMVRMSRLVGVREGDLPADRDGFYAYFETMVDERLGDNETVQRVLRTMSKPGSPPLPWMVRIWPAMRILPAHALKAATFGLLPEVLRERFGVPWGRVRAAELEAVSATSRAMTPLLPRGVATYLPQAYLRWRRDAIAGGPLGEGAERDGSGADHHAAAA